MDVIRVDRLPATPWKNKGGTTRTLAVSPPDAGIDAEDWRVALSDIDRPGPFSSYVWYDRLLLPLATGLRLGFDGAEPAPAPIFQAIAFDGATPTMATLEPEATGRPLQVVNLLLRRGASIGNRRTFPGSGRLHGPAGTVVLYVARGGFNVVIDGGRPQGLEAGSAAVISDGHPLAFEPGRPWSLLVAAVVLPA